MKVIPQLIEMINLDNNNLIIYSFVVFSILHILWYLLAIRGWNKESWLNKKRLYFSFTLSTIHAGIVGPLATYLWYKLPIETCVAPNVSMYGETTNIFFYLCDFMIGYLIADFIFISLWLSPTETNIHHIVGIIGLAMITNYKTAGKLGLFFVATEISTIFLNIRWFLMQKQKQEKDDKSHLMTLINGLFLFSFFSVRIIGIPWILGCCIDIFYSDFNRVYAYIGIFAAVVINCLNIYWFVLMIIKLIVILRPGTFDNVVEYYKQTDN